MNRYPPKSSLPLPTQGERGPLRARAAEYPSGRSWRIFLIPLLLGLTTVLLGLATFLFATPAYAAPSLSASDDNVITTLYGAASGAVAGAAGRSPSARALPRYRYR